MQILGGLAILAWSTTTSGLLFYLLSKNGILRVKKEDEEKGLDISHHGGSAYNFDQNSINKDANKPNSISAFAIAPTPQ